MRRRATRDLASPSAPEEDERLTRCEERIGHRFQDRGLLRLALTHASGKATGQPSNERLEFLGDSVLGMVVAAHLFEAQPDAAEGELTRVRSVAVSARSLAQAAEAIGLAEFVHVGKSLAGKGAYPVSLRAALVEAIVAAIYLDAGLDAAAAFILRALGDALEDGGRGGAATDWKSSLQRRAQRDGHPAPTYRVVGEEGAGPSKRFEVVARVGEKERGRGEGRSKKEAEQRAAEATLAEMDAAGNGRSVDDANAPSTELES